MGRWKYFTDAESVGMTDDTCEKRDAMRELHGAPIIQTCGIRTQEQAIADGCKNSAHVTGHAFDAVLPPPGFDRDRMFWAAGKAGFLRVESAPRHIHCDTDYSKPTPCFFQGVDH